MKISAIEIGTNSTKMIVVEKLDGERYKILEKKSVVNRLSNKMYGNNSINAEAMDKGINILGEFLNDIKEYNASLLEIFSTSVLRDASNKLEFIEKVKKTYGYEVKVISGEQEATLAYEACSYHAKDADEAFAVIDIGGGSTEIIIGTKQNIEQNVSLDIGAVRLCEVFLKSDPISVQDISLVKEVIINQLKQINFLISKKVKLIGTGGTVKAIGTIVQNLDYTNELEVNGLIVKKADIERVFESISIKDIEERKHIVGLNPKRADVIVVGLIILLTIMDFYEIDEIIISSAGVLEGYIQTNLKTSKSK